MIWVISLILVTTALIADVRFRSYKRQYKRRYPRSSWTPITFSSFIGATCWVMALVVPAIHYGVIS